MYAAWQDYWLLYHKCIFDGENSLVYAAPNVTNIDIQTDVYSDWKEWKSQYDNTKFLEALRTVGGDPTTGIDALGGTYFFTNGWRFVVTHGINFDGNLFSDNYPSPYITEAGVELAESKFSNLIDKVAPEASTLIPALSSAVAPAVWGAYASTFASTGTMGALLNEVHARTSGFAADGVQLSSTEGYMLTKIFKRLGLDPADALVSRPDRVFTESSSLVQRLSGSPDSQIVASTLTP